MPARQGASGPTPEIGPKRSRLGRCPALAAAFAALVIVPVFPVAAQIQTQTQIQIQIQIQTLADPPDNPGVDANPHIGGPADPPLARDFPRLFGSREIRSSDLGLIPKWTRALDRVAAEELSSHEPCNPVLPGRCMGGADWKRFLVSLVGKAREVQLEEVNRYVNQAPYRPDRLNYGTRDHWATPVELFARGGDCEDYAIAKFVALRALGFSNSGLRLVVVQDLRRRRPHAVVVVNIGDRAMVLDNQLTRVVPADRIGHYRPFYSVNEKNLWLHPA